MITRDEALQCINRFKNQLYLDGVINLTKDEESEKQFENTRDFVLDRYYKENNELTYYEKDYLLKYLLFWCGIGEAEGITNGSDNTYIGYRLNMAHPLLSEEEKDLFLKAKKSYFPELFENSKKEKII